MDKWQIWHKKGFEADERLIAEHDDEDAARDALDRILEGYWGYGEYKTQKSSDEPGVWEVRDRDGKLRHRYWIEAAEGKARVVGDARCECCDFTIGEADEQTPELCANCGTYTHNLGQQLEAALEKIRLLEEELEATRRTLSASEQLAEALQRTVRELERLCADRL